MKLKNVGIAMNLGGVFLAIISMWDLFGAKSLPIPITVTGMLMGIASTFLGPALVVFTFSPERRKKIADASFILSLVLILIGLISAKLHIIGARVEIIVGVLIICFFYGALALKMKYDKWRVYARSGFDALSLSLFDFVGVGALVLGFLFKIQHWPLSGLFITIGIIICAVGVLAWNQKFKKEVVYRKEAEDKLTESKKQIELQHEALEEKQKEIIDSINYAKRIQQSHLPTEKYIDSSLKRLQK